MTTTQQCLDEATYRDAMGRLLVMYTQIDQLIMEICAERIARAPDEDARLALAKQVGDESRHVMIQKKWIERFGTDPSPVFSPAQENTIRNHFRSLDWLQFLTDMYICVEALGSEAVEKIVPLADPGTRESLREPLCDELDHVAFGISRLRKELASLDAHQRNQFISKLPQRIDTVTQLFHELGIDVKDMFTRVGADYTSLCNALLARKSTLLAQVTGDAPVAA